MLVLLSCPSPPNGIGPVMFNYQANSPSGWDRPMEISESTYVGNTSGFINSTSDFMSAWPEGYRLAYQTLNQFLINNKSMYEESKYGAYFFDGGFMSPQTDSILAYTILQNTTSVHASAIFANVGAVCCARCLSA
jgi:hypothetical protein